MAGRTPIPAVVGEICAGVCIPFFGAVGALDTVGGAHSFAPAENPQIENPSIAGIKNNLARE